MKELYDDEFYRNRDNLTRASAKLVLDRLLDIIPPPASAVDLGCGIGVWLSVLKEKGVGQVLGLDGPWVNQAFLAIQPGEFRQQDFTQPLNLGTRFDLSISLEVAEHFPAEFADQFVASLTSLADFVLFSAAPPQQGGVNHVNEQPMEYWLEKFEKQGYVGVDCLRPYLWNDRRIASWYRQNVVLMVKASRLPELRLPRELPRPNSYLHPELYVAKLEDYQRISIRGALDLLKQALGRRLSRTFGKG